MCEGDVMSFNANRGVHISTGAGIVAHVNGLTAYAEGDESELNTLVARLNALAGESWTEVVRALTTEITILGYDDHPKLACVSVDGDKVAAFVFGDTTLSLTIDDAETILDGSESSTWIDVTLHGTVERVMAGAQSDSPIVGVLRDGVVPAGGFMLDTNGPMPASGRWVDEMQQPEAQAAPAPVAEPEVEEEPAVAAFAVPVVEPVPETAAPIEEAPVEPIAEAALDAPATEEVPEELIEEAPEAPIAEEVELALIETPVAEETLVEEALEAPATEEVPEELIEQAPEAPIAEDAVQESEPYAAPVVPTAVAGGVAAGAAGLAASGLFTRLDQRINPAEDEIGLPISLGDSEAELDPNASVFDRPDLIDAEDTEDEPITDESTYDEAVDTPEALANPNDVEPSQPAEPSPIASLTQTRPQLRGVRCLAGHLTKPDGSPCMTCGARIDPDIDEEMGDRPPLGMLTFDDGAKLSIERPAAIGSGVPAGYSVAGEPATIIRLDDGEGGIHSVHMEMRLSGWDVEIADMGSESGTYIVSNGERQTRTKLRSGQTAVLEPGMTIEAGRRTFTYTVGPTPPMD